MIPISPLHSWIGAKIGSNSCKFDRKTLDRYQLDHLQNILAIVKQRSTFYQKLFSSFPDYVVSLEEFSSYPFTTASDLQQDPYRFICVSQEEIRRIVTLPTSGTTGPPKRLFFTAADQELTIDFFKVGMSTLANPGDRVLILLPGQRPGSVGDLLRLGLERLGCVPFPYGPVDEEKAVLNAILNNDINILVGAPVHIHRLVRLDHACSILPKGKVQKVLCSTDILPGTILHNLEQLWECEVFDHYGMTETGLGGGVDCAAHQGYHLREADLYYEIIDPNTGRSLPDGETGEVVVTTLTRTGMPLIRYRTGDISRLIPDTCPCGSFLKRLARIQSRLHAGVKLGQTEVYPTDLDEALFKLEGLLDFSASLVDVEPGEELVLELRCLPGYQVTADDVVHALEQIPVLRSRLTGGGLKVSLGIMVVAREPAMRMVKRRIPDLRTGR
jgi:phenylacetate-CoA ligase